MNITQYKKTILSLCALIMLLAIWGTYKLYCSVTFKPYTIGLIYTPNSVFHERVNTAIKQKAIALKSFGIKEFCVTSDGLWSASNSGSSIQMKAVCNSALDSGVDLFICTGRDCARALIYTAKKRNIHTPIIFVGTWDPIELGFVHSLDEPGGNVTGVIVQDMECSVHPVEILKLIKPTLQKLLVPYSVSSAPYIESLKNRTIQFCRENRIKITLVPIANEADVLPIIADRLPDHDSLLYFEGDLLAPFAPCFGKLASQHNITMFASSPDGFETAALTYCINPAYFASPVFELAFEILMCNQDPATLPVRIINLKRRLTINTSRCNEQDLFSVNPYEIETIIYKSKDLAPLHNQIVIN